MKNLLLPLVFMISGIGYSQNLVSTIPQQLSDTDTFAYASRMTLPFQVGGVQGCGTLFQITYMKNMDTLVYDLSYDISGVRSPGTGCSRIDTIYSNFLLQVGSYTLINHWTAVDTVGQSTNNRYISDTITFTVSSVTGLTETTGMSNIKIYPNPIRDIFFIENPQNIKINQLEIWNLKGQRIKSISETGSQTNVSSLASGMYLIKIYSEAGIISKKFIKK